MFASSASFVTSALAILAVASTVSAQAADGVFDEGDVTQSKIDYQPSFTAPKGGEVYIAGQEYTASWDQTLPDDISADNVSQTADLVLGYDVPGSTSLHLNWTLASQIPWYAPNPDSVTFVIPDGVPSRDTYFLVLLGSTRNQSPRFSVVGNIFPSSSTSSEASSSASSSTSTASSAASSAGSAAQGDDTEGASLSGFFSGLGLRRVRRAEAGKARLDQ